MTTFNPGLDAFVVRRVDASGAAITVHGDLVAAPPGHGPWRNKGARTITVHDVPHGDRPVTLVVRRVRHRHGVTGQLHLPAPEWLSDDHRLTRRAREFIQRAWLRESAPAVAARVGCSEKSVRRVAATHATAFLAAFRPQAPRRLGLDECHLGGRARAVLCDHDSGRLVEIGTGHSTDTVERLLRSLDGRERIEAVAIDFTPRYRDTVRRVLGDVPVIVDRWHAEKHARDAFEHALRHHEAAVRAHGGGAPLRTRLRIDRGLLKRPYGRLTGTERAMVDFALGGDPDLVAHWQACQAFCTIFDHRDRAAAEADYEAWVRRLPPASARVYAKTITLVSRWRNEIFACIDHRVSNGPTENLNRRIKELSRLGAHQVPFDVFRARALMRFGAAPQTATAGPAERSRGGTPSGGSPTQLTLF